jgi:hypothetical protein
MSHPMTISRDALEDELREHFGRTIAILRPYALSHGHFHDLADVGEALRAAVHELERAEPLLRRLKRGVKV